MIKNDKVQIVNTALIVDDDCFCRSVAREIVRSFDVEVYTAKNAREAVNIVKKISFTMVFIDFNMPCVSGLELFKRLIAVDPLMRERIALITADESDTLLQMLRSQGVRHIFTKPLGRKQIAQFFPLAKDISRVSDVDLGALNIPGINDAWGIANFMGSKEAYVKTLVHFPEYGLEYLDDFKSAVMEGRHADCKRLAHSLKGSSSMVGALELRDLAIKLEQILNSKRPSQSVFDSLFAAVKEVISDLVVAISEFRDRSAGTK